MSIDLSDYSIIKEGEAEILMHAKNEVFYNKTQVPKSSLFCSQLMGQFLINGYWIELLMGRSCYLILFFFFLLLTLILSFSMPHCN